MTTALKLIDSSDSRARWQQAIVDGDLATAEQISRELWHQEGRATDLANLGAILRQQGRLHEALELFLQHETELSCHVGLSVNAANALRDAGDPERSIRVLEAAMKRHGRQNDLILGLATTLQTCNLPGEASALLEELHGRGGGSFSSWFQLGVLRSLLGDPEASLKAFDHAQALHQDHGVTAANRITLLKDLGRLQEARNALQLAKASENAKKNTPELQAAEAGLLMAEQDMEAAAALLSPLCKHQPEQPLHWLNLAATERGLRRSVRPDRILRRGLTWHPNHQALSQSLLQSLTERGQLAAAKRLLQQIDLDQICRNDLHFFNLQFLGASSGLISEELRKEQARRWERQRSDDARNLWMDQITEPNTGRRLRVGYLSSDYCNHPVSRFLLPVLQHHDHSRFEIWGLHTGPHWDQVSDAVKEECDHWIDLTACNDVLASRAIADQRLDVLVELGGYTGLTRIGICRYEPAPVQMSYLGFPGATYLNSVPWWIGDSILFKTLPALDRASHQLAEVSGGYMCMPKPAACSQAERTTYARFRFGSFNHGRKLSDQTIALWSEILETASNAELVLKSFSFIEADEQRRIRQRFERGGIDPQRIVLLPWAENHAAHLAQYNQIDLALDPIPYGGATTTAEALWMGIPVICLHGQGMVGSLAASLLKSAGLPELIQTTPQEYVNEAVAWYQRGPRNREKRERLIQTVEASALNQPKRVSAELERIYEQALQKCGAGDS